MAARTGFFVSKMRKPPRLVMWTVVALAAAGCAAAPAGEAAHARPALPEVSLAAADPQPQPCLPPPTPLEEPGADPVEQALRHYMRGRLLMTDQETVLAAEELRQAAHLAPDVAHVWVNLGLAQYDAGKVTDAIASLEKALELAPADESALYFRGRIAAARGNLAVAADLFNRLTRAAAPASPFHMLGMYHLARARESLGEPKAAADAYATLLDHLAEPQSFFRRYPELFLLYRSQLQLRERLARLLLDQGDAGRAVEVLGPALQERPTNTDLLDLRTEAALATGDHQAAREWAGRLIDANPQGDAGYLRLADIARAEGKPESVIPDLQRYHKEHPENRALALQLAQALDAAGRNADAAELYRDLVQPGSGEVDVAAALKLADIHLEAGRPIDALGALAATMVDEVINSAALVKAAKIIDSLPDKTEGYRQARRLTEGDVSHYGPFVLAGMLAEAAGRPADALSMYDNALARQPKAGIAYSRKADLLIQDRRYADALAVYRTAVGAGLDLPIFRRKMGMLLEELGHLDEAIQEYRRARQGAPADASTAYFLAAVLARQGEFDEAAKELRDLLVPYPKDFRAHIQLGGVYLAQGKLAEAYEMASRAQALEPQSIAPLAVMAEVRFRQEKYDETIDLVRQVLKQSPDNESMRALLAYALAGKKDLKAAADEMRALLAAQPENIDWRYLLSGFYSEMGDTGGAERELQSILQTRPDHAPSNNDLGYLWADRGINLDKAETLIRLALKADPQRAAYLDSLGWVLYKKSRFQDAVGLLEEATRLDPDLDAVLWDHLGDSYWRADRRDDAVRAWKTASDILKKRPQGDRADDLRRVETKLRQLQSGGKPDVAPVPGASTAPGDASKAK